MNKSFFSNLLLSAIVILTSTSQAMVSQSQIIDALNAEKSEPTIEVAIRKTGPITQYHVLDMPEMVGKKVLVKFYDDEYSPPSSSNLYPVAQLVLTKDYLDAISQSAVEQMKTESITGRIPFQEVGVWVMYTKHASYRSQTFTSNDPFMIENKPVLDGLDEVIQRARNAEGYNFQAEEIELFHTHLEKGEALSFNDLDFQKKYYGKTVKNILAPGGIFSSYAVPVQGKALFRSTIQKGF